MISLRETAEVRRTFAASEYGQKLDKEIRWSKYKPVEMSNARWVELLGRDANNLEHMNLMHGITVAFIRHSEQYQSNLLNDEEKEKLLLVAINHDDGEAIVTDISYGDKTVIDEDTEKLAYETVVTDVFPEQAEKMRDLQDIIFDHSESKLGEMFFAIECLGYLRTALIAADLVSSKSAPEGTEDNFIWMVADVLGNVPSNLIAHSNDYVAVRDAIALYRSEIDSAFKLVNAHPRVFMKYDDKQINKKASAFVDAKKSWQVYQNSL